MEAVVTVVTFEDIFQSEAEKKGKYSEDYRTLSAQIILDKQDMANLGVKEGQNVLLRMMWGVSSWSPRPLRMIHISGWPSWSTAPGRISWSGMMSVRGYPPRSRVANDGILACGDDLLAFHCLNCPRCIAVLFKDPQNKTVAKQYSRIGYEYNSD